MKPTTPKAMPTAQLINELQSCGVRLVDPKAGHESRRGGAGPSDHKAITIDGMTVMVPVHTAPAFASPYVVDKPDAVGRSSDQPRRRAARRSELSGAAAFLRPAPPPTAFRIGRSRCCTAATCSRPRCCKPASAIRAGPRPASSAPSANRSPPAARSNARRRRSLPRSPRPPSSSMASSTW